MKIIFGKGDIAVFPGRDKDENGLLIMKKQDPHEINEIVRHEWESAEQAIKECDLAFVFKKKNL